MFRRVLVLVACSASLIAGCGTESRTASAPGPATASSPSEESSSDAGLSTIASACRAGRLASCDKLWFARPDAGSLRRLAASCGGRVRLDSDGGSDYEGRCTTLGSGSDSGSSGGAGSPDPDDRDTSDAPPTGTYTITLSGTVGAGSGVQAFRQRAVLLVVPPLDRDNASGNGANPVDVGIETSSSPVVGVAGALLFATNIGLSAQLGSSSAVAPAAVDVASVALDGNRVSVEVDGDVLGQPTARINYLNIYNATSSVAAQIHNVLAGELTASIDESSVSGRISLQGSSGSGGPSTSSYYRASFSGTRTG